MTSLDRFTPPVRAWFEAAFSSPTEVQERGWAEVAGGRNTLMCAPTGSGKTLAAFLWSLDRLAAPTEPAVRERRCRVLYVSPLKALAVDVERNLRAPLRGIAIEAERLGLPPPDIRAAIRSGDTPSRDRRDIQRHPPDILITTPESLFLMLTSAARRVLAGVETVIVDEIHSVAPSKRGAHLALSLERLAALADVDPQRLGLSATQRPLVEVARFLGGTKRPVAIVDAGRVKPLEITVEVPVEDMTAPEMALPTAGPAARIGQPERPGEPRHSLWPAIHPRILELIREHRSTIVFVNSRRLAERLAARLNELAGEELVRAHHGSIAKEQRAQTEDALKSGRLPGLVATSSLELGIDMGAVDLVVQVESPGSAARGIQRIGRAGHSVGEPSTGVILPKYRGDLLECAVVSERMLAGEIETTRVPHNPLDVLAQQIVAMCAMDEWDVDELAALVRRAYPFAELGRRSLEATLDMLSGRYPSDEFSELRPRIVWDRTQQTVRGRAGAQRLAVTSGGTIPDRGLYSVHLLDDGRRVGELDEEMVYECRPGDTFILGASTWRIADITASRVLVTPAPGEPGRMAFWHGDTEGRPVEVGRALGALVRELRVVPRPQALRRLGERSRFDGRAARNLLAYLDDQAAATGAVPDDRTVVIERTRDELGDWRLCVLTPFGARIHAPWALAAEARMRERLGVDVQGISSDDGFALRLPDIDEPPDADAVLLAPDEVRDAVTAQLHGSPLFAARFRENAARALLLPRRSPGQRTPLWKQRQRSADLIQVASRYPDFPIIAETYRECLGDTLDVTALAELMRDIASRSVRVVAVDTERASPFSASLLFDYIAQYLYADDAPLAERRAQALTIDRELLAELLGTDELRELIDPQVIASLELDLGLLDPHRRPRDEDSAVDVLRRLGDLDAIEAEARGIRQEWLERLGAQRRAVPIRIAGTRRWIAAEDAGRYRDGLGVAPAPGLPQAFLDPVDGALEGLLLRYARTHVPFVASEVARRWELSPRTVETALAGLAERGEVLGGAFRPDGRGAREWCHPEVLRALRRRSVARLRRQVEPVAAERLARFLPAWHGIGSRREGGLDRLVDVLAQLQGCPLPASVLERDVLPARVTGYRPQMLDRLISLGEVVWVGRGALGSADGRVAVHLRADAPALLAAPVELAGGEVAGRLREHLATRGASFFRELYVAAGGGDQESVLDALWEMVWSGEVTNDTFEPLRALGTRPRAPARRRGGPVLMRLGPPRAAGRWSLVSDLGPTSSPTERLRALAGALLQRHGVLTREAVVAEGQPGGFAAVYPVLRAMEDAGRVRRGYFLEGLGAAQFALPGAVDRLRELGDAEADGAPLALAATDPANPFGVTLPWPQAAGRMARTAGALVVLDGETLRLFLERGGRTLLTAGEVTVAHVEALTTAVTSWGRVEIHRADAEPVVGSALEPLLRAAGFGVTPRGVVLYGERHGVRRARGA